MPKSLHIYEFDLNKPDDSGKCGCCNWETDRGFYMAPSKRQATKELRAIQANGGNAQCKDCFSEFLVQAHPDLLGELYD